MTNLCAEACMFPVRELNDIRNFKAQDIRATNKNDFYQAMMYTKKSVAPEEITAYHEYILYNILSNLKFYIIDGIINLEVLI